MKTNSFSKRVEKNIPLKEHVEMKSSTLCFSLTEIIYISLSLTKSPDNQQTNASLFEINESNNISQTLKGLTNKFFRKAVKPFLTNQGCF